LDPKDLKGTAYEKGISMRIVGGSVLAVVVIAVSSGCAIGRPSSILNAEELEILSAVAESSSLIFGMSAEDGRSPVALRTTVGLDGMEPETERIDSLNQAILTELFPELPSELWHQLAESTSSANVKVAPFPQRTSYLLLPSGWESELASDSRRALGAVAEELGVAVSRTPYRLLRFQTSPAVARDRTQAVAYFTTWDVICSSAASDMEDSPASACNWRRIAVAASVAHLRLLEGAWKIVRERELWSVN
jgi:hypothetical protein